MNTQQTPVGWMQPTTSGTYISETKDEWHTVPVYTAPPSIEAAVLAEREACAKVCEELQEHWLEQPAPKRPGYDLAAAIRARSEK